MTVMFIGKFIDLNAYVKKKTRSKINQLPPSKTRKRTSN